MTQKKISKAQIKRNRKAWLEALRSGNYKQTKGKLRSRNGAYCCLGVACEVAEVPRVWRDKEYHYGDAEVLEAMKSDEWHDEASMSDYERYDSTGLPRIAREWLGVSEAGPKLAKPVTVRSIFNGVDELEDSLIELNDTYGWSFAQIADAIEKNGLKEGE